MAFTDRYSFENTFKNALSSLDNNKSSKKSAKDTAKNDKSDKPKTGFHVVTDDERRNAQGASTASLVNDSRNIANNPTNNAHQPQYGPNSVAAENSKEEEQSETDKKLAEKNKSRNAYYPVKGAKGKINPANLPGGQYVGKIDALAADPNALAMLLQDPNAQERIDYYDTYQPLYSDLAKPEQGNPATAMDPMYAPILSTTPKPEEETTGPGATQNPEEQVYGVPRSRLDQMYADALYDLAMQNKDYRKGFDAAGYGDKYGSWGAFGSLEENESEDDMFDVSKAVLGLDKEHPELGIEGLYKIYEDAGVINDKMSDDEKVNAFIDYTWGDNAIDPIRWLQDEAYQEANPFRGSTAAAAYTKYWMDPDNPYALLAYEGDDALKGVNNSFGDLTNEDIVSLISAGNLINQANAGWRASDTDINSINDILKDAGDSAQFAFLPKDKDEIDGFKGRQYNPLKSKYSAQAITEAIKQAEAGQSDNLDKLVSGFNDSLASALQTPTGKRLGRKDVWS